MQNRYLNLAIQEPFMVLKAALIIAILIAPAYLNREKIKGQEEELAHLREKEKLVAQIPEFRRQMSVIEGKARASFEKKEEKKPKPPPPEPEKKGELNLNGIFFVQDQPVALINQAICYENDQVEGFTVIKITSDYVDLKNYTTNEEKTLTFPSPF